MIRSCRVAACLLLCVCSFRSQAEPESSQAILPGTSWKDQNGVNVQGHGGNIIQVGSTFYWFGENKINEDSSSDAFQSIRCYSSADLVHWKFVSDALTRQKSGELGPHRIVERPKVLYNGLTRRYVMYMHIDNEHYSAGKVGVAISRTVGGPYNYLGSYYPLGLQSWDMNLFEDDDGTAYLLTHAGDRRLHIDQLSTDYLTATESMAALRPDYEAPAMLKFNGRYYIFGSELTGWSANDNKYAMATNIAGPWSKWGLFAPEGSETFDSQTAYILSIKGSQGIAVVYMGDRWNTSNLGASTYVWLPLNILQTNNWLVTNVSLSGYTNGWRLDVGTGLIEGNHVSSPDPAMPPNLAAGRPALADSAEPGNPANAANDENITTRWCAKDGQAGHWWQVDLGRIYTDLTGTEVYWEAKGVYKYRIDVSSDSNSWTTVVDKSLNTVSSGLMDDHFSAPGRYVRITVTGLPLGLWASFYELRVFGSNDVAKSQ
ncbi:MAG TPA: family 43 glycosylhydrolase [Verrucomicrobiae bacterium]|nr:family 43 glycosylhydrolase [Verrucomicrobiae bacterium]